MAPDLSTQGIWGLLPSGSEFACMMVSIVCGGILGFERSLRFKPAGIRTILLICVGSCLFALISRRIEVSTGEPARIAAQVVTGIGFLGAGAILRGDQGVRGLTTAATIWVAAAVGMAAGFGYFGLAFLGTLLSLAALLGFPHRKDPGKKKE